MQVTMQQEASWNKKMPLVVLTLSLMLRSKGLKVRHALVVLRCKWSQGTGTLNDVGSALESLPKMNVLE